MKGNLKSLKGLEIAVFYVRDGQGSNGMHLLCQSWKRWCSRTGEGVVLDMLDWVTVGNDEGDQSFVVSSKPPVVILLGYEMESGQSWAFGASGLTVLQHSVEFGLSYGEAVWSKATWAAGY
jgi:hypothetical protein